MTKMDYVQELAIHYSNIIHSEPLSSTMVGYDINKIVQNLKSQEKRKNDLTSDMFGGSSPIEAIQRILSRQGEFTWRVYSALLLLKDIKLDFKEIKQVQRLSNNLELITNELYSVIPSFSKEELMILSPIEEITNEFKKKNPEYEHYPYFKEEGIGYQMLSVSEKWQKFLPNYESFRTKFPIPLKELQLALK